MRKVFVGIILSVFILGLSGCYSLKAMQNPDRFYHKKMYMMQDIYDCEGKTKQCITSVMSNLGKYQTDIRYVNEYVDDNGKVYDSYIVCVKDAESARCFLRNSTWTCYPARKAIWDIIRIYYDRRNIILNIQVEN